MPHATATQRRKLSTILLWALFCAGLSVQAFAPRLQIENGAFVIPAARSGALGDPAKLVRTERRLQLLSALLTATGALGLAWHYARKRRPPE